jgi:uncharacterized membrane protein YraQ (UPF0718 family)
MLFIDNFIALVISPLLMLGLTVASIMKVLVPSQLMAKYLGKPGPMATIKAGLFGAPLAAA